jgi:transcription termination factor Rho
MNEMDEVSAIEFLIKQLNNFKNNKEFFKNMNSA